MPEPTIDREWLVATRERIGVLKVELEEMEAILESRLAEKTKADQSESDDV